MLSDEEILRYHRQINLLGFDFAGQERLKAARVLIAGLGGLGCAAASWLAAAGSGSLTLLDFDVVSHSNLQRQLLHRDATIGQPKVVSARAQLAAINPHCHIEIYHGHADDNTLEGFIAEHDVVLDCTDNATARNQLNALCFKRRVPLISGAAIRMEGQLMVFNWQPDTPCYRCLSRFFSDTVLSCAEAGVMSPLVGVIGALQAMEAIKVLTAYGTPYVGKILLYDALSCQFRDIKLPRDRHCDVCKASH